MTNGEANAAVVAAAKKALGVMRALGWHIAMAGEPETDNEALERAAAQEAYDQLAEALGVNDDHRWRSPRDAYA